jgi:hypothetical protein
VRERETRERKGRNTFSSARRARAGGHGDGVSEWQSAVVFPVASANPRSDGGVGGACGNTVNLVLRAAGPHPLFIAL